MYQKALSVFSLVGLLSACGDTNNSNNSHMDYEASVDNEEVAAEPPDQAEADDYSSFIYQKLDSPATLPHQYLSTWGSPWIATDEGEIAYHQALFLHDNGKYSLITEEWYRSPRARTGVVSVLTSGRWHVSKGVLFLEGLGTARKGDPTDDGLVDSLSLTIESSVSDSLVGGLSYELVLVASNRGPSHTNTCAVLPSVKSLAECGYENCCLKK